MGGLPDYDLMKAAWEASTWGPITFPWNEITAGLAYAVGGSWINSYATKWAVRNRTEFSCTGFDSINANVDIWATRKLWPGPVEAGEKNDDYGTLAYGETQQLETALSTPFVRQYGFFDSFPIDVLPLVLGADQRTRNGYKMWSLAKWNFSNA